MAVMQIYNAGLDQLADWETAEYHWVLLRTGSFDRDHVTVISVLATGTEVTMPARLILTTPVRSVDLAGDRITYSADDPSWGGLGSGEDVTAVLLYRLVTNDADSVPLGWWDISPAVPIDAASPLTFTLTAGLVAYTDQAA